MNLYPAPRVDAILWDFDGTLADSSAKNIAVSKQILAQVAPRLSGNNLPPCLHTKADYHKAVHSAGNWRELYRDFFGMSDSEIEAAGPLWETYQLQNSTAVKLFDGIFDAVSRLADIPHGICSANESRTIKRVLKEHEIAEHFPSVIGYEGLAPSAQKPAAEGGVQCLRKIFGRCSDKTILYIGDHITDVLFARNLAERLEPSNTVISIAVTYSGAEPERWSVRPDKIIEKPSDLTAWLRGGRSHTPPKGQEVF